MEPGGYIDLWEPELATVEKGMAFSPYYELFQVSGKVFCGRAAHSARRDFGPHTRSGSLIVFEGLYTTDGCSFDACTLMRAHQQLLCVASRVHQVKRIERLLSLTEDFITPLLLCTLNLGR